MPFAQQWRQRGHVIAKRRIADRRAQCGQRAMQHLPDLFLDRHAGDQIVGALLGERRQSS
jgi:hypothetical protein